ncbi:MAG: LysM peptidoglycan-binding domain-containing protein [Phycisphaerae bacterium]
MTRETKIGLLVGLAFIILFGIILSEKGTGRSDQLSTPPIAAYKPVVELIPPTSPPSAQLTRNHKDDVADRLKISEPNLKVVDRTGPLESINNNVLKPVETSAPVNPTQSESAEVAPNLKKLLPPSQSRSLTQIPASNATASDLISMVQETKISEDTGSRTEVKIQVAAVKTHTVQSKETLLSICRQYYPGQAYQMLPLVKELNKISKPEKLMCGQVIKLPTLEKQMAQKPDTTSSIEEKSGLAASDLLLPVDNSDVGILANANSSKVTLVSAGKQKTADGSLKIAKAKQVSKSYVVQSNDTLTKIAKRVYGNERAWTKIYELNKKMITDPRNLKSGLKLRMPPAPSIATSTLAAGPKVD